MKRVKVSIPKVDGLGLLKGKPAYTDDLIPDNTLIVKFLRSPHAYVKIKSIDISKAQKIPGVECILTHHDVPKNLFTRAGQGYPEPSPHDKRIFDEYARYVGDEIAAVAAIDEETAIKALREIHVEYEILPEVMDFEKSIDNETIIHMEEDSHSKFEIGFNPKRNIAAAYSMEVGNVEEEFKKCDYTVEQSYYTHAQAHAMMEPHTAFAYIDFQERLTIVTATQVPFHVRRIISKTLEYPMNKIRVIKPRIGGGFGGKQALHGEFIVALMTLKTGKPCKIFYTRKEVFESTCSRHKMRFDIKLGADKEGNLKAIDMKGLSDTGAYGEHALTVFMVAGSKTLPLYNKINSVKFSGDIVYTNNVSAGAFRGYGAIQGNFALESAIDELAKKMNLDPVKFREKNMIKEGETSAVFKIMGEGREGVEMYVESCKLDYCIKRGKELIKWDEKYPYKKISEDKIRSVGMAIAMQGSGIPYIDMGSAIIKLNEDGFFNLMVGATDIGTGSDTILAQMAAEVLETEVENIVVYSSDTDLTPFDVGAYASSTTYVSGNSVISAAKNMRELIIQAAAEKFEINEEEILFDGKTLKSKDEKHCISLKDFSTQLYYSDKQKQLVANSSYVGHISPPPYMAGFVEIEIDIKTGKIDVIEFVGVVDCGTPINPNLAKIQVEGGILQGIGMTIHEEVKINAKGKMLTNNLMNYKIPARNDFGKITVEFAESYEPSGPFGAKSVGEIGIDTPPAVIANAVFNATGIRIRELPITPEKLLLKILQ